MNKQEVKQVMTKFKVSHRYFDNNEWCYSIGNTVYFEDGASIDIDTFWSDRTNKFWNSDWFIVEPINS